MSETLTIHQQYIKLSIWDDNGRSIIQFWSTDNQNIRRYNNLRDENPQKNIIRVSIPKLFLPRAQYTMQDQLGNIQNPTIESPVRTVLVQVPPEATGVEAWQSVRAFAWAPAKNGFAQLQLGKGSWEIHAQGTKEAHRSIIHASQEVVALQKAPAPMDRQSEEVDAALLVPGWLALILMIFLGLRANIAKGFVFLPLCIILPILFGTMLWNPSNSLLQAAGQITDPMDSLALAASLDPSTPIATNFQYPEGSNWLRLGPAWLGYMPAVLFRQFTDPLLAHNLGFIFWFSLLSGVVFHLARSLGCSYFYAVLYTICALCSPILIDEIDAMSLDRATLYIVPLLALSIYSWSTKGRGYWFTAIVLGSSIYFQLYYSLYFVVLIPIWILGLCWQKNSVIPLLRIIYIAPFALLIALPSWWILQQGAMDSYQVDTISLPSIESISPQEATRFLQSPDHTLPVDSGKNRLLSAAKGAISPSYLWNICWMWLPFLCLCAWKHKYSRAWILLIAMMAILSLGPVWVWENQWSSIALPYAVIMEYIPGFDQLKNVYRYALLLVFFLPLPVFVYARWPWKILAAGMFLMTVQIPKQHIQRLPKSAVLSSLSDHVVCMLPLASQSPDWLVKVSARHGLRVLNPAPFEQGKDTLTPMYLDHPLLNRLALFSSYREVDILHLATIEQADIMALHDHDIRWFVLPKKTLLMEDMIIEYLDTHLQRWKEDGHFIIWTLPLSL